MTESLVSKKDAIAAYYFFDSTQKESLSPYTFLRSILHQILRTELLNPALQRRLEAIFVGPNGTREPEIDEWEALIIELCDKLQNVTILVDGIDEAEQEDQRLVLHVLKNAIDKSQAVIKLFISSRPGVNVPIFFGGNGQLTHINIRAQDTQIEIDKVIRFRVENVAKTGPLAVCEPATIDKIIEALRMKASGRYNTQLVDLLKILQRVN